MQKSLKLKYRQSYLGILWTMLVPAASAIIYYWVFQFVMRVRMDNYLLFLLTGILPWTFFSSAISQGMESMVTNSALLNKIPIAPLSFPFSETITSFINFLFSIPILLIVGFLSHAPLNWTCILLVPLLGSLFLMAYSIALMLSIAFVFVRDLRHVLNVIMQIWFYVTPIIYDFSMVPENMRKVLLLNPITDVFTALHGVVMAGQVPALDPVLRMTSWTLTLLLAAIIVYKRFSKSVAENL